MTCVAAVVLADQPMADGFARSASLARFQRLIVVVADGYLIQKLVATATGG